MFKYFPHTEADIKKMLQSMKLQSIEELFQDVDGRLVIKKDLALDSAKSELEVRALLTALANENQIMPTFRGAGAYDHYTPSIIPYLVSRQEFLTTYTPYQPEIAQGTLRYIFEFQSMMTSLTNLDYSNASMYDGATATAEAVAMAVAEKRSKRVLVSATMNPNTIRVIQTYAKFKEVEVVLIAEKNGVTDLQDLETKMQTPFSAFVVQNPNYYGQIEDLNGVGDRVHAQKGLFIMNVDPSTLAVLKTPKEYGADIAAGDCQSLGIPLQFGGPYLGFLACSEKLLRKMPGRIAGKTVDEDGRRGFVLTLQAREQHIRREKANSNICSNQSLMALFATIYLSLMGENGLKEAQMQSHQQAHYLQSALVKSGLFEVIHPGPFFKEFVLKARFDTQLFNEKLSEKGLQGPLLLPDNQVMFAVTEKRTKAEMDLVVATLKEVA